MAACAHNPSPGEVEAHSPWRLTGQPVDLSWEAPDAPLRAYLKNKVEAPGEQYLRLMSVLHTCVCTHGGSHDHVYTTATPTQKYAYELSAVQESHTSKKLPQSHHLKSTTVNI